MQSAVTLFPTSVLPADPVNATVSAGVEGSDGGFLLSFEGGLGKTEERSEVSDATGAVSAAVCAVPNFAVWTGAALVEAPSPGAATGPEGLTVVWAEAAVQVPGTAAFVVVPDTVKVTPDSDEVSESTGTSGQGGGPVALPRATGSDAPASAESVIALAMGTVVDRGAARSNAPNVTAHPEASAKPAGETDATGPKRGLAATTALETGQAVTSERLRDGQDRRSGPLQPVLPQGRAGLDTAEPVVIQPARSPLPLRQPVDADGRVKGGPLGPQADIGAMRPAPTGVDQKVPDTGVVQHDKAAAMPSGLPDDVAPFPGPIPLEEIGFPTQLPQSGAGVAPSDGSVVRPVVDAAPPEPGPAREMPSPAADEAVSLSDPTSRPVAGFWERFYMGLNTPSADDAAQSGWATAVGLARPEGQDGAAMATVTPLSGRGVVLTAARGDVAEPVPVPNGLLATRPDTDRTADGEESAAKTTGKPIAQDPRTLAGPVGSPTGVIRPPGPLDGQDDSAQLAPDTPLGLAAPGALAMPVGGPSASLPTVQPLPVPQVVAQITTALSQSKDGATELALSPDELGHVRLRLKPDAANPDRMVVMITFERPETLDLFRRHAGELADALRQAGFAGADIGFGQQGSGSSGSDRRDSFAGSALSPEFHSDVALPLEPAPRLLAGASLDLRL
jgi:Flagellar hook-length control protein FliK